MAREDGLVEGVSLSALFDRPRLLTTETGLLSDVSTLQRGCAGCTGETYGWRRADTTALALSPGSGELHVRACVSVGGVQRPPSLSVSSSRCL